MGTGEAIFLPTGDESSHLEIIKSGPEEGKRNFVFTPTLKRHHLLLKGL